MKHFWTKEEKKKLCNLYPKMSIVELMSEFPFATESSIENAVYRYVNKPKIHKWTKTEINLLVKLYPKHTANELIKFFPFANETSIRKIAKYYGVKSKVHKWTKPEITKLLMLYPSSNMKKLLKIFPFATRKQIWTLASKHKIKKIDPTPIGLGLCKLLEPTEEAAYWLGFILADGSTNYKQLQVSIHKKDKHHLNKLRRFFGVGKVNGPYSDDCVSWSRKEYKTMKIIRNRFDLKDRKTYNPPSILPYKKSNLLLACFAGLIDGDGCISINKSKRYKKISIGLHESWYDWLNLLTSKIGITLKSVPFGNLRRFEFKKKKMVTWVTTNNIAISNLAKLLDKMNLPLLKRKWNKIDRNYQHVGIR